MIDSLLVLGDSVPLGRSTDARAWPARLPDRVDGLAPDAVETRGATARTLASLAEEADGVDADVVLVHAGHNDAQLSGGDPRVAHDEFRRRAADLDAALSTAAERHAFVAVVPLVDVGAVPFADDQPARSLAYDETLAAAVDDHVALPRSPERWRELTVDGVHPAGGGHAVVADRVAAWLEQG